MVKAPTGTKAMPGGVADTTDVAVMVGVFARVITTVGVTVTGGAAANSVLFGGVTVARAAIIPTGVATAVTVAVGFRTIDGNTTTPSTRRS
ncbi:MAG: hypothetical protein HGB05_16000, partial [Chloroflexi bacterium]|nr:hypothetical protein [Chloroflexota bacterium]